MKFNKYIYILVVILTVFVGILFMIDYHMTNDTILQSYNNLSTTQKESKDSSNKTIRELQETYNEDGSLTLTVNNKGTYSDLYDGWTSEEFVSEGDQTTNKEVTAGDFEKDYGAPVRDELGKEIDFASMKHLRIGEATSVFEPISTTMVMYNFDGKPTSDIISDGTKDITLYDGIPAEWGWGHATDGTVWHMQNTMDKWLELYSDEINDTKGKNEYCTYSDHLNKEHGVLKGYDEYNGVTCLQICISAAIRNCGFIPSGEDCDTSGADLHKPAVIVVRTPAGEIRYIPCITTDGKAHTYPGGAIQTTCARYSKSSKVYDESDDSCSDFSLGHAGIHTSIYHYDYSKSTGDNRTREATAEFEVNFNGAQPIVEKSGWEIIDGIYSWEG